MSKPRLTAEDLLDSLTRVVDPGINVNIVDLGLVYGVELAGSTATVQITLRSRNDPGGSVIESAIRATLTTRHPELDRVDVDLVWEPEWQEHFMSEEGRRQRDFPIVKYEPPAGSTLTSDDVIESLRLVLDPEVGINIVDLGLVYDVELDGDRAAIEMTMTTRHCPLQATIEGAVNRTLQIRHPELTATAITVVWDPPWDVERITDEGRAALGW